MNSVFIQGIGFLGTILFFLSYQFKSNRSLFRVQFLSYLCYTMHFFLLGAITGGVSYILNAIRSFCLGSKSAFLKSWPVCFAICLLQVIALYLTFEKWWSILPIVANIAATIGGYTYNGRKIRAVGMFVNSPLWIVYNIIVGSWAGVVDEIITELSMIISIVRYGWNNLEAAEP